MLGFLAGSSTEADLAPILRKRLEVVGTVMRTRGLEERIPLVREFAATMLSLFDPKMDRGAPLRPVLERTYPMAQLADAHRVMEGNATFGKIVVVW
jgi:NADPH:quinone reductase-like Zn-dependent oxidoreductase